MSDAVLAAHPRASLQADDVKQRRILLVTTGHSRSKNGVASLAYDPVVHAEGRLIQQRKI